jgi:hypothetical protein
MQSTFGGSAMNFTRTTRPIWIAIGILAGVVVIIILIFYLGEIIGVHLCSSAAPGKQPPCELKDLAKAVNDARGSILQVFTAIGGAGALYFTWRNFNRTVQDSNKNHELSRETRVSENFIKAVDQLGNESEHVRVGGIYGLARLLRTADENGDYWPIMDVLTSFTRARARRKDPPGQAWSEDTQAAINVLARRWIKEVPRRKEGDPDSPVDLSHTDLSNVWMAEGHFELARFDDCYLCGADFTKANLTSAVFIEADLRGAGFSHSIIKGTDFSSAELHPNQLDVAIGDKATILPKGYPRPPGW